MSHVRLSASIAVWFASVMGQENDRERVMAAKFANVGDAEIIELEFSPTDVLGLAEVTRAVSSAGAGNYQQTSDPVRLHKSTAGRNGGANSPVG